MTRARRRQESEQPSLVALGRDEAAAYLFERIESGRGLAGLRRAEASGPAGEPVVLLASDRPEWFLAERLPGSAYRRVPGSERTWHEWPLAPVSAAAGLGDPPAGDVLLVGRDGAFRTLRLSQQFSDAGAAVPCEVEAEAAEPGAEGVWATSCALALAPARRAKVRQVPELWLLPADESWRVEGILAASSEEEHDFLLVAAFDGPEGAMLAVREVARGRRAPRLIPERGRTFCALPGTSNAFVRHGLELVPRLPGWLCLSAVQRPGSLLLLEAGATGAAGAIMVPESAFLPASRLRTFVLPPACRALAKAVASPWPAPPAYEADLPDAPKSPAPQRRKPQEAPEAPAAPRPGREPTAPKRGGRRRTTEPEPQAAQDRPAAATTVAEPRDERLVALERALVDDPEDHEAWLAYAHALAASGDREGAVFALEERLWHSPPGERARAWEELVAMAKGAGEAARGYYGAVLSLEGPAQRDHLAWAAAAVEAWRLADAPAWPVRKKRRWIAWSRIGVVTGDVIESERRREALLAELSSGVRDYEAPRFLRARLIERYSATETSRGDDPAALAKFLEAATAFANETFGPPGRWPAEAAPDVIAANACLQTSFHSSLAVRWHQAAMRSEAERALDAAGQSAARLDSSKSIQAIPPLAKFAAATEAVKGPGAGFQTFKTAVAAASKAPPDGSAKQALTAWVRAAAAMPPQKALSDLAETALEAIVKLPPVQCASALRECAKDLASLGLKDRVAEAARAVIALGRSQSPPRRFLAVCEYATTALHASCDGRLPPADAEAIIGTAERMHAEIDEFAPAMLAPAFAACGAPWARSLEFSRRMRDVGDEHAALIGSLAGLRCLAESGDRDVGLPALEAAIERTAAWEVRPGTGALRRMRILIRLARLAPAFGARERGMRIVRTLKSAAEAASQEKVVRTELMCEAIKVASALGVPDEASRLLGETLGPITAKPDAGDLETLNEIVEATAKLGDVARGMSVLSKVADDAAQRIAAHAAAADASKSDARAQERMLPRLALFKYHKALAGCAASALLLGDEAASARYMELALSGIDRLDGADRLDVAQATSKGIAELPPERRRKLGLKALDVFAKAAAPGASQHSRRLACEGAERLVAEVASGETAFAAAMTRWLGDEERRIRARVVAEQWVQWA